MRESLIIFTRYPEPGKTKTRLIPALGEKGAAMLHRQMTEQKLAQAKKLQTFFPVSLEIHFAGGNEQLMKEWLGSNITYKRQSEGDIGCRMASAFHQSFKTGMKQIVLIGTDCPELNTKLITQAFEALIQYDLVLGPALDGGYYLIGLNQFIPELFTGISWSTAEVFSQTVSIAEKLELAVAFLPPLSDVDCPEDLAVWNANKP